MAKVANTHIIWHGEDQRTEADFARGIPPILERVVLAPGEVVPNNVPVEVQEKWAETPHKVDLEGNQVMMVKEDPTKEAPDKQAGPPFVDTSLLAAEGQMKKQGARRKG